jgi:hypothetical protein
VIQATNALSGDLNRALTLFVGHGTSPFPSESEARVEDAFGAKAGASLVVQVRSLLSELKEIQPDWTKQDLITGSKWAVSQLQTKHPAIDAVGASALEWCFSYWWK